MVLAGVFREREEEEYQRQQIADRWQNAGHSILSSVRMVRNAETLGDKFASGAERYASYTYHRFAYVGSCKQGLCSHPPHADQRLCHIKRVSTYHKVGNRGGLAEGWGRGC